jgi:hypothetical protein
VRSRIIKLFSASLVLLSLTVASTAFADVSPADRETARGLMDNGDKQMASRDYPGALKSYSAADAIMNVPSTGYAMAKALEETGKWVEALDKYLAVGRTQPQPGEPGVFTSARAQSKVRSAVLDAQIPSLQFEAAAGTDLSDVQVSVDDSAVPAAALSLPKRVNPGVHVVTAKKAGFTAFTQSITVAKSESKAVRIALVREAVAANPNPVVPEPPKPELPKPEPVKVDPPKPEVGKPAQPTPGPRPGPEVPKPTAGGYPAWGYVGMGVGAAGLVVGSIFGLKAFSSYDKAKTECPGITNCTDANRNAIGTTVSHGNIATIGFAAGAVGGLVALIAVIATPSAQPPRDKANTTNAFKRAQPGPRILPQIGLGYAGMDMTF